MNMPAPLTIAARRAMVEELMRQEPGISQRSIAARLGVGKDTIRRDIDAIEAAQRQAEPEEVAEPHPPPGAQSDAPHAPPAEPGGAPPAPPAEDRLIVAYDDQLRAGLAVLAEAGHSPEEAARLAVTVLARAYEGAWKFGLYPPGVRPHVQYVRLHPYKQRGPRP